MEIYEQLYTDTVSNCDPGDLIQFEWIDEFGDPMTDLVRVERIDVDETVLMVGYSEVTNEKTTYELDPDLSITVLGG